MPIISILPNNKASTDIKASTEITEDNTSSVTVPFSVEDSSSITVYYNGLLLIPDIHYTISGSDAILNGYTANSGDTFTFIGTPVTGSSVNPTASNVIIADTDGNFSGVTSVEGALKYIADNWRPNINKICVNSQELIPTNGSIDISVPEAPIQSVSLNGQTIAPINNNVNITVPSVPVKSISVNNTAVDPVNGNVNITVPEAPEVPVKSVSLNGTNVAPDVSGNVALTNMMQKNVAQAMGAQLIAQNNTNYTTKQVRNILLVAKSASSSLPTGANGDICIIYKD